MSNVPAVTETDFIVLWREEGKKVTAAGARYFPSQDLALRMVLCDMFAQRLTTKQPSS